MRNAFLFALLAFVEGLSPALAAKTLRYAITDVGPALAYKRIVINNKTQVAGTFETNIPLQNGDPNAKAYHPFLWQHGRRRDLGIMGIYPSASVSGINDQGQIAGTLDAVQDGAVLVYQNHAFLWTKGEMHDLGAPPGDGLSEASTINNNGTIIGVAQKSGYPPDYSIPAAVKEDTPYPVLLKKGKWQRLNLEWAFAINDKGQIVGSMPWPKDDNASHAVLWQHGTILDLGQGNSAVAINNKGQILIKSNASAVIWQNGKTTALGGPAGYQNLGGGAINGRGVVVGSANRINAEGDPQRAMVWRDGQGIDLNTLIPSQSGWTLQQATDINDKGQIVGIGTYHGKTHAFLLTPRK